MFPDGAELGQCIGAFCVMDPRTSLTIHPHMEMIASRPRRHLIDQLILFTALDPLVIGGGHKNYLCLFHPGNNGPKGESSPQREKVGGIYISFSFFFLVFVSFSPHIRIGVSRKISPL